MKGEKLETVGVGRKCLALWKCQAPIHLAGLFFLALLPRLFGLSTFMTPDEGLWMERTALFGQALLRGDWADTFQSGHPGVTTKWLGLAGLAGEYLVSRDEACLAPTGSPEAWGLSPREDFRSFLAAVPKSCARHLAAARLPIVLLSALSVGAIYLLCRKLFGWQVALLAGVLIAFDPFFLAHSRFLHHDALLTIFMSLSLLSFLIYLREGCSGWLFLSAVCGGLAFLSKASGLFLAPLLGLLALVQIKSAIEFPPYFGAGFVIRWVLTMAVWAIAASLAVFFFWPAMWVNPGSTAQAVLANSLEYAAEGHQFGSFFLGRAALDPGPFFYPLNLLFRLTPPVLAGLAFAIYLVAGDVAGRPSLGLKSQAKIPLALLAYVLLFAFFMALGRKKFDRYLLPLYPALDILAAWGLWAGAEKIARTWGREVKAKAFLFAMAGLQIALGGLHYPYYLTFYNPLVGGGWLAPKAILVGWGEGLDEAVRYLNEKPGLKVASAYGWEIFEHLFQGERKPLTRRSLFWDEPDYAVFYLNQVQRMLPEPELLACFREIKPERVIRLKGIDYAWIYPAPGKSCVPGQFLEGGQFGEDIALLSYEADASRFGSEGKLKVDLYWQGLRRMEEDYIVHLKLLNGAYRVWWKTEGRPAWGSYPTNQWRPGEVVGDRREIEVLPGTPPGAYHVAVALYDLTHDRWAEPQVGEELLLGPVEIPRRPPPPVDALDIENRLRADWDDKVRLLGYNLSLGLKPQGSGLRPGDNIHLTLFWECLAEMKENYTVFAHLLDENGKLVAQKDNEPVDGFYPTSVWQKEEIVRDQYDFQIPPEAPPGKYRLEVGFYRAETGERLPVQDGDKIILAEVTVRGD